MNLTNFGDRKPNNSISDRKNRTRLGLLSFGIGTLLIAGIFLFPFINRQQTAHALSSETTITSAAINTSVWYQLINRNSGKALEVTTASTADGANIVQWTPNSSSLNQQWQFVPNGNYYNLKVRHSNKVADVSRASTVNSTAVIQWTSNGGTNQQWSVVDATGGYIKLINRNSGKGLDVNAASTANGGSVIQWTDHNGTNQQWQLVQVGNSGSTPTPIAATPTHVAATPTPIAATPTHAAATPTPIVATPTPVATTPPSGSCTSGSAPSISYALGTRVLNYTRVGRSLPTQLWYPRTGSGADTANATIASGAFPLILFSHGLGGTPFTYSNQIRPLAQAGFIIAAPYYPNTKAGSSKNLGDVPNQALDASYVITQVLALNTTPGDMFSGHIRTACGVGAAGHSAGGATTHALLTIHRDSRVTAAVMFAAYDLGGGPISPAVKALHIHGDQDPTCSYSGAQSMYKAYGSWPKAFLTEIGGSHDSYIWTGGKGFNQAVATDVDWMRYALYGDTTARNRLSSDATSSVSTFTSSGI